MSVRQRVVAKRKKVQQPLLDTEDESDVSGDRMPTASKRQKVSPEKRLRRYRPSMTIAIRGRVQRALHQRLYLLDTIKSSDGSLQREYKVLGQTGNVYSVVISHLPSCTCMQNGLLLLSTASFATSGPDHAKGHLCKHIIFVLHRVLKVGRHSSLLYQEAFLTDELNDMFVDADAQGHDANFLAEQQVGIDETNVHRKRLAF